MIVSIVYFYRGGVTAEAAWDMDLEDLKFWYRSIDWVNRKIEEANG